MRERVDRPLATDRAKSHKVPFLAVCNQDPAPKAERERAAAARQHHSECSPSGKKRKVQGPSCENTLDQNVSRPSRENNLDQKDSVSLNTVSQTYWELSPVKEQRLDVKRQKQEKEDTGVSGCTSTFPGTEFYGSPVKPLVLFGSSTSPPVLAAEDLYFPSVSSSDPSPGFLSCASPSDDDSWSPAWFDEACINLFEM